MAKSTAFFTLCVAASLGCGVPAQANTADITLAGPAAAAPHSAAGHAASTVVDDLAFLVESMQAEPATSGRSEQRALVDWYSRRGYQPLWLSDAGLSQRGAALVAALQGLQQLGLQQPALRELIDNIQRGRLNFAAAEFELSWRLLAVGRLLTKNLSEPAASDDAEFSANQVLLAEIEAFDAPEQLILSWEPRHPDYAGLKYALSRYQQFAANPWPRVKSRRRYIKPGYSGAEIVTLRERLKAEGYPLPAANSPIYSDELVEQVQAFQRRRGLTGSGVIGPATRAALNVPASGRVTQLQNSLARLFALPNVLGSSYVWVNIPAFKMAVYRQDQPVLAMDVIVGKPRHATPEMVEVMESLEFNPYWNVPVSISREELIPAIINDPKWLVRNQVDVLNWHNNRRYRQPIDWQAAAQQRPLPFRLRQRPGRKNPLGQVKFLFPNKHAVYMHDTPAKRLFSRSQRAFSHGCVRLAEPLRLAEYVLQHHVKQGLDIPRTLRSGKNTPVPLDEPLPVYLSYSTAWVDRENQLHFSPDLYRKDHQLPQLATQIFELQHRQLRSLQLALKQHAPRSVGRLASAAE